MRMRLALMTLAILTLSTVCLAGEIHEAAAAGDLDRVGALLDETPALAAELDEQGRLPLHYAALHGNEEMIRRITAANAEVNLTDGRGYSPLLLAVNANSLRSVRLLVESGADTGASHRIFGRLIDFAFYVECKDGWSGTTDYLRELGLSFDPDGVDFSGDHRVFLASWFGHTEMLEYLLRFDPQINVVRERDGATPLIDVSIRGYADGVRQLVEHGADIDTRDKKGNTALRYAVEKGGREMVTILLDAGADIAFTDRHHGRSLLHLAAIKGYRDIAELLLQKGVAVEARDNESKTPLYYAARYGNWLLAELLMKWGASENEATEKIYAPAPQLVRPLGEGAAVAWYLNHRGWAVKTSGHLLIFDSEQILQVPPTEPSLANGFLNAAELADQNIFSLYTCFHHQTGEQDYVHDIRDSVAAITYIHNGGDHWRGAEGDTAIVYLDDPESRVIGDLSIHSASPIPPGMMPLLAHLCEIDGLTIFYDAFPAKDLDHYRNMLTHFRQFVDRVDIAFLPIPEPGEEDESDFREFIVTMQPRAVCLLDSKRREYLFPAVADKVTEWGYETQVFCPGNPGDKLEFMRK